MITDAEVASATALLPSGSFIAKYMKLGAASTDGPHVYHLPSALVALASVAPMDLEAQFSPAMKAIGTFWALLIGDSGARKTSCLRIGRDLVYSLIPDRVALEPGSPEGLIKGLFEHNQQTLYYNEFGAFLARTRPGSYLSPMREMLTNAYDNMRMGSKLSKAEVMIDNPRVSTLGATTPEFLEDNLTYVDWQGGFMGRMGYFIGAHDKTQPEKIVNLDECATLTEITRASLSERMVVDPLAENPFKGFVPDALTHWTAWSNDLRGRLAKMENPQVRLAGVRTPDLALKVAVLATYDIGDARQGGPWYLPKWSLEFGIAVAEMHLRGVQTILSQLASNHYEQTERNVLRAIGDGAPPWSMIYKRLRPRMGSRALDDVLTTLRRAKLVVMKDNGPDPLYAKIENAETLGIDVDNEGLDNLVAFPNGQATKKFAMELD